MKLRRRNHPRTDSAQVAGDQQEVGSLVGLEPEDGQGQVDGGPQRP